MTKDQYKIFNIGKYDGLSVNRPRHPKSYKYRIYHKGYQAGINELRMINLLRGKHEASKGEQTTSTTGPMAWFK